jgi:hypothetical protein
MVGRLGKGLILPSLLCCSQLIPQLLVLLLQLCNLVACIRLGFDNITLVLFHCLKEGLQKQQAVMSTAVIFAGAAKLCMLLWRTLLS